MNAAYVAGFFDGEGCLMIYQDRGYYRIRVALGQKTPEVLQEIQRFIKVGRIGLAKTGHYYLRIDQRAHIRHFLDIIRPYAIVKKQHIQVLDQFFRFPSSRKDPRADQRRLNLFERLRELNSGPRGIRT